LGGATVRATIVVNPRISGGGLAIFGGRKKWRFQKLTKKRGVKTVLDGCRTRKGK